jgi:hypothetical protein
MMGIAMHENNISLLKHKSDGSVVKTALLNKSAAIIIILKFTSYDSGFPQ